MWSTKDQQKTNSQNRLLKRDLLYRWPLQETGVGGSDYFTLSKILLQNVFYILVSNCFSKWRNFIENRLKLTNNFKKIENIFKKLS
jgi:hypothetical protein